jgi:hypothetical protein
LILLLFFNKNQTEFKMIIPAYQTGKNIDPTSLRKWPKHPWLRLMQEVILLKSPTLTPNNTFLFEVGTATI